MIAFPKGDVPEQLYFDTQTGLLVRRIVFTSTPLGNDPAYVDYDDYRDAGDGVKVPFLVQSYTMTQKTVTHVQKVQDNVAIDSRKFNKPAPKAQLRQQASRDSSTEARDRTKPAATARDDPEPRWRFAKSRPIRTHPLSTSLEIASPCSRRTTLSASAGGPTRR